MTTRNRTRSLLGVLICFTMLLGLPPTLALAEPIPAFSGGAGTQSAPYLIGSAADLVELQTFVNTGKAEQYGPNYGNFEGYYFKQTVDIDLTGMDWDPIGYSGSYYFAGHYDGDDHLITNAVSDGKADSDGYSSVGIFGWAAFGSISNLHVDNAAFIATGTRNYSYAGGIAGVTFGASMTNCSVSNSKIESRRNNNNNCAGSISGFATGGTFANCAAENNTIKSMAYGGGFVGEIDDDYGAGTSAFTNCYVAGCSVITSTQEVQGMNDSGGFAGELTASALTITNCFVYDTAILIGEDTKAAPGLQFIGLFAGNQWQTAAMSPINAANCYYGAVDVTQRAGAASEKSKMEFADETVLHLLGSAFSQGVEHPVLRSEPVRLRSISVGRAPSRKAYFIGDDFDPTYMAVTASYSNAASRDITDYVILNGTDLKAGQTSVTIRYTERGITRETTQEITVNAKVDAATPVFGAQPATASYTQGANAAALTVTASVADGGVLNYQWYSSPTDAAMSGTAIGGAASNSYTPVTTSIGTVYYYCIATNTNSSATGSTTATAASYSAAVTISARPNPVITRPTQEQILTVYEGETAQMSVAANQATGYQWYINRKDGRGYTIYAGSTASTHTTSAVKRGDDGFLYYCRVYNGMSYTDSPVFTLKVLEKVTPPATGDNSQMGLWIALCFIAMLGMYLSQKHSRGSKA